MYTIDHTAVVRATAIMGAWRTAWEGEYPCPNGHGPTGEDCHCEPRWDSERRARLVALMIALYNSTIARLAREPYVGENEDRHMDWILDDLSVMGYAPAAAELARLS